MISILPIHKEHMHSYARLLINEAKGHYDPSDHLIIAHAITERMSPVSSDHKFDFYKSQGLEYINYSFFRFMPSIAGINWQKVVPYRIHS